LGKRLVTQEDNGDGEGWVQRLECMSADELPEFEAQWASKEPLERPRHLLDTTHTAQKRVRFSAEDAVDAASLTAKRKADDAARAALEAQVAQEAANKAAQESKDAERAMEEAKAAAKKAAQEREAAEQAKAKAAADKAAQKAKASEEAKAAAEKARAAEEAKWANELSELRQYGFEDAQACIAALEASTLVKAGGDLKCAMKTLLKQQ